MTLALHRPLEAPPDRGRLLTAEQVADLIGGGVSTAWVRANVPHKLTLGRRTVRWYERDVYEFLASLRD